MDGSKLCALRLHCKTFPSKVDIAPEQAHYIDLLIYIGKFTASNIHSIYLSNLGKPALSMVTASLILTAVQQTDVLLLHGEDKMRIVDKPKIHHHQMGAPSALVVEKPALK